MIEGGQSGEAVESSASDFAFGADLFEESIATESTVVEPAMEGVGAKIWGAIKSIFNAIANFFKNLFKKATTTESSIKQKRQTSSQSSSATKPSETAPKSNPTVLKSSDGDIKKRDEAIAKESEYKKQKAIYEQQEKERAEKAKQDKIKREQDEARWKAQKEEHERQHEENQKRLDKLKEDRAKQEQESKLKQMKVSYDKFISLRDKFISQNEKETIAYADLIASAIKTASSTQFKTIMTKISATIKATSQEINHPSNMNLNHAIYNAHSQKISKEHMDEFVEHQGVSNDIKMLVNINETLGGMINKINSTFDEIKKHRKENADRIRQFSDINDPIVERTAKAIEAGLISQDQSSKIDGINMNIIKDIKMACKDNSDFCNKMIDFCKANESRLDTEGRELFTLCKKYMEASKYYNNLSIKGLNVKNMHTSLYEQHALSDPNGLRSSAFINYDHERDQKYWRDDD